MKKYLLIVVLLAIILSGCGAQGFQAINDGVLRDRVYSVEPRPNVKTWVIWMVHDDVGAYCTTDAATAQIALDSLNEPEPYEVIIHYKSINFGSEGYDLFTGGCKSEREGTTSYLITSIESAGVTK
jgi:hypothetical protein